MMSSRFLKVSVAFTALIGLLTAFSSVVATQASATASPITLAYITSLTGPGASEDAGSQAGFLARIDEQNAMGGVNGHKIVPLGGGDQTSPTVIATAVQDALSRSE